MKPALLLHNDVGSAMETDPSGLLRRLSWVLLLCTLVVPAHAGEISIAPDPTAMAISVQLLIKKSTEHLPQGVRNRADILE